MSSDTVTLTVDGVEVQVPRGATVLQACESIGVEIPTLCTDPRLKPYGACRMCVVEVQPGPPRPIASCTTPAGDGMTVVTNSQSIRDVRKHVIELQLQHHPLDCPYCDQAGTCELQDEVFDQEIHQSPYETVPKAHPEEILNEVILINHNRCILCGRCVRMCDEQIGVHALDFVERSVGTFIAPAQHEFMDCERCGMCIETCPVGALLSRPFKHAARSWQTEKAASTCPHCAVGCSLLVESRHGAVVRTRTNGLEDPGRGILCAKGFFGHSFVNSDDRITQPMVRRGGVLWPVSWRAALDAITTGLRDVLDAHGAGAVGVVGSPNTTNEDNYTLQRFARAVLGTNNVYSQDSGLHATARTLRAVLGSEVGPHTQSELLAADLILVVGADIGQTHNVVGAHIKQAARDAGRKLVVATRLASGLDDFANVTARVRPGAEAAFLSALAGSPADGAEQMTGVDAATFDEISRLVGSAESVAVAWDTGIWTLGRAAKIAQAAANLALARDGVKLFPLPERANSVGTFRVGMAPDLLPGARPLADADARNQVGETWGVEISDDPGLPFADFVEGPMQALYVMGEDVVGGAANPDGMRAALRDASLVIAQDIFMNVTTEVADVVLPGASFAEKGGHFTNFEGRLGRLEPAIPPVGEARPDWEVVARIAAAMGADFGWRSHEPISAELATLSMPPSIPGSRRAVAMNGAELPPLNGDRLVLATEQHLYTAGVAGRHAPSLTVMLPDAVAELNPDDAERLQIAHGDRVHVASAGGEVNLKALVARRVPSGVVSLPDRFLEAAPRQLDPRAPDGTAVRVSKA
jgi:predicted molibdopterin-dependent oxidoreductase YjgC